MKTPILSFLLTLLLISTAAPHSAFANLLSPIGQVVGGEGGGGGGAAGGFEFKPIVSLPLPTGSQWQAYENGTPLACYLNALFSLAITVAAAMAVIMIVIDGFKYMVSEAAGNKKDALSGIRSALFGLILLLASWLILNIIDPHITSLSVFDTDQTGVAACGNVVPVASTGGSPSTSSADSVSTVPNPLDNPPVTTFGVGGSNSSGPTNPNAAVPPSADETCYPTENGSRCFSSQGECAANFNSLEATGPCAKAGGAPTGNTFSADESCYPTKSGGDHCFSSTLSCVLNVDSAEAAGTCAPQNRLGAPSSLICYPTKAGDECYATQSACTAHLDSSKATGGCSTFSRS
ncbi:MAG: hypothetical protein JO026_03760 [Patescibacteria group bacterium]|nr:hypothetical protein [Patescibacteria group bacterium]